MARALELAERGWGRVAPNPMVGAVVVRSGEVVGEGFHADYGGPHAEVVALEEAGEAARGAELFVTLEPCNHTGKTGPCTRAIAEAGIRRVVYAIEDPSPEAGGGAAWLRDRGLTVESGVCEAAAADLNAIHRTAHGQGRTFVALKYAVSLDARLSERPGQPTEVTSGAAIERAHRLRAGHDAVMVGIGTVLADDPRLTVREWREPRVPPARVVLDSGLRTPPDSALLRGLDTAPLLVVAASDAPRAREDRLVDRGAEVVRVERSPDGTGLDLDRVLSELWARDLRSVLCEGGGRLGSALLAGGHVDRLYLFIAPRMFGEPGVPAFQGCLPGASDRWRLIAREMIEETTFISLARPA